MGQVTYLNIYIYGVLGFIGATLFGCFYFYNGMEATSFLVSTYSGQTTNYFDSNQYDLYFQGFVYCFTFAVAGFLLLTVMAIPNREILERQRGAAAPGMASPQGMTAPQPMAPPQAAPQPMAPPQQMAPQQAQAPPPQAQKAPEKAPAQVEVPSVNDLEDDEFELETEDRAEDTGDSDVIFGTGRVTEESIVDFIHKNPDSAIKFLYRKTLDGKALPPTEDEIYAVWQKRGLSRARVRDYILQIMDWTELPADKTLMDIWSELRDQIFELTH
ncbi:MAG: hypothetical protein HQM13_13975 [SAR324 cluster bacterium]|nr:hypothetical protein [SAR324 cluster bacterium]